MSKIAKLAKPDIIEHVKATQEMCHETFRYFLCDSSLFKAIRNHIISADKSESKDCAFFKFPAEKEIVWHRGTGASIRFKNITVHGDDYGKTPPTPCPFYTLELEVSYILSEDRTIDYPPESDERYEIAVPIELERNFTETGFSKWIDELREKRDKERHGKELQILEELIKKYPAEARKLT